jgi:hypothetical protein
MIKEVKTFGVLSHDGVVKMEGTITFDTEGETSFTDSNRVTVICDPPKPNIWSRLPKRFQWTVHNMIGHPLCELFCIVGLKAIGNWIHDNTVPIEH